jgi:hypothetical protein
MTPHEGLPEEYRVGVVPRAATHAQGPRPASCILSDGGFA